MAVNALTGANLTELTDHRGVRECLQWFTREKQWINEIHLQFCRVPAPTFLEQRARRLVPGAVSRASAGTPPSIAPATSSPSRGSRAPYVALTAHLDTVLAPRNKDDIAVEPDGRFRGPGVSDNGAGLAALLAVARVWKNCAALAGSAPRPRCWWPMSARKARATCSACGTFASSRPWPARSSLSWSWTAPTPTTSPPAGSAAAASKSPSPAPAAIAGAITASATRCTPCAARWRCSPKRAWTAIAKSAVNVGLIEGGIERQRHRPTGARQSGHPLGKQRAAWTSWWTSLSDAVERARELENQRATGGKVAAKLREIGSRPAAALPEIRRCPALPARRGRAPGHPLAPGYVLHRRQHPAFAGHSRLWPSAPGGVGGGAHTSQEWFRPEGRDLGLETHLSDPACCSCAAPAAPAIPGTRASESPRPDLACALQRT